MAENKRPIGGREWERAEPIPLETIASELRRQSDFDPVSETRASPAIHSSELVDGDSRRDLQAEIEWLRQENGRLKAQVERLTGGQGPRRVSDVLDGQIKEYLQRSEEAEQAVAELENQNAALRKQVSGLKVTLQRKLDELRATTGEAEASDEVLALRHELELVRAQAAADIDSLRLQLKQAQVQGGRDVGQEADMQALRQEIDHLRAAVETKEIALEDLSGRCRILEDGIEDRDRAMERLLNEAEQMRQEVPSAPAVVASEVPADAGLDKETTQILDHEPEIRAQVSPSPWRLLAGVASMGLLLGALAGWWWGSAGSGPPSEPLHLLATPPRQGPSKVRMPASATPAPPAGLPLQGVAGHPFRDPVRGGGLGPVMVPLAGAEFVMGSASARASANERPAHRVELGPFAIARTETTLEQYRAFARATGRAFSSLQGEEASGRLPVAGVSWQDAVAYADWLSRRTGYRYRLPSEAEWEYAARGGSAQRYWWGRGKAEGREVCFDCGTRWDRQGPAPVGSLVANGFGLYDMAGNLSEWVQDCYHPSYQGAPVDGRPWLEPRCRQRVARGGAYNKPQSSLRSSQRYAFDPAARLPFLGFRVVRERP